MLSGAPAEVDAVTVEPVRALRWEVATLRRYLEADPETRMVFQLNLTRDLAGKLRRLGEDYLRQPSSPGGQSRSAPGREGCSQDCRQSLEPVTNDVSVVDIASMKETTRIQVGFVPKRNVTVSLQ